MSISRTGQGDVFAWLDRVRARPGMYIGAAKDSLRELETLLAGYYSSLDIHGVVEPVPDMSHHFRTWLYCTTGWSTSAGFALAFKQHAGSTDQLARFFRLVDRYRKLKPDVRLSVARRSASPDRPTRIDIIRYAPTRLHFLRLWRGQRTSDDWILMDGNGSHQTSLTFAKRALISKFPEYASKLPTRGG
jgi:hypothetical protein